MPEQSERSYPQQGFTPINSWYPTNDFTAMAENSQQPRLPTHEDLPFDSGSKKPVRHQRIDFSLADHLFKRKCLLRTKDPLMGNLGQNKIKNMGQDNMGQDNMGQDNMDQDNMGQHNTGQHNMGQHNIHKMGHMATHLL